MKLVERKAMWHHAVFSGVICAALLAVILIRHDVPGLLLVIFIAAYVAGNTLLHYVHKDFRKETLYEYVLIAVAVAIVLLGAARH